MAVKYIPDGQDFHYDRGFGFHGSAASADKPVMQRAGGGRVKRAMGGPMPGPAPAASMQPMTRPPMGAQDMGDPLAHATVSMPAKDMSSLASGAVKMGAKAAMGALAARQQGAQGLARPMAPMTAPAAAPPPAPAQGMQGMQGGQGMRGLKDGGRVKRADDSPIVQHRAKGGALNAARRNALPSNDFALPGRRYPVNDESHARNALARANANASPAEQSTIRRKVASKFPGIHQKG